METLHAKPRSNWQSEAMKAVLSILFNGNAKTQFAFRHVLILEEWIHWRRSCISVSLNYIQIQNKTYSERIPTSITYWWTDDSLDIKPATVNLNLIEIVGGSQVQYQNHRSCNFDKGEIFTIPYHYSTINEALRCYRDDRLYMSCSPGVREKVQTPAECVLYVIQHQLMYK